MTIKVGDCQCGCGLPTKRHPTTWTKMGWIKGEPRQFLHGHWSRTSAAKPILRLAVKKVQPIRHRQMKHHRKLGPYKAGAAMKAKALLKRLKVRPAPKEAAHD